MSVVVCAGAWATLSVRKSSRASTSVGLPGVTSLVDAGELSLQGTVTPERSAIVYSPVGGFVRWVGVEMGDQVKTGQVVAEIDGQEHAQALRLARVRFKELARNRRIAGTVARRYRRLARAGVVSRQQADDASTKANSAEAALKVGEAEIQKLSTAWSQRYVKAPFAGVVVKRNIDPGSLIVGGSGPNVTRLFEIADIGTLRLYVDVPQSYAAELKVGTFARISSGKGQGWLSAKVVRTAGALDAASRTLRAELRVEAHGELIAGSQVNVIFTPKEDLGEVAPIEPAHAEARRAR